MNITGYKDLGGGLATLTFDNGQESQPVVLDDKLKAEVAQVASLVSTPAAPPAEPAAAPQPAPVAATPAPAAAPQPPAPAAPTVASPAAPPPVAPPAMPGGGGMPVVGRVEENALGADAAPVRERAVEAARAEEQGDLAGAEAKAAMADERARLVGEELARQDAALEADKVEADRSKAAVQQATARYEEISAAPLDPGQAFGSEPAWFKVLTLIGMAAGAASSGRNMTLEAVDREIESSLARQKEVKNSEISRLQGVLGDEQAALAATRARMLGAAEKRFELGILEADNEGEAAFMRASRESFKAKRLKAEGEAIAATATGIKTQSAPPVAGPAVAPVNAETAEERALLQANGVDEKALAAYGKARIDLGVDSAKSTAANALDTIEKVTQGQDVPGVGPVDKLLQPLLRGEDAAAVQQTLNMVNAQFVKAISGAAATDSEREHLQKVIEGRGTLADVKRGLAMVQGIADRQLETLDGSQPNAARAFEGISGLRESRRTLSAKQAKDKAQQQQAMATAKENADKAARGERPEGSGRGMLLR